MKNDVVLREVREGDIPISFEQQLDPVARGMAAFTAKDSGDRDAFTARWTKMLGNDSIIIKTILFEGQVAGYIASFERLGELEVSYWIGKEYWGKGIATKALSQFVGNLEKRPLFARAARDNLASIRVLEKCGFTIYGYDKAFAHARGEEIEELILKLGANAP